MGDVREADKIMNRDRGTRGKRTDASESASARKVYQKPEILSRESLEVLAVVCAPPAGGKSDVTCSILSS